MLFKDKKEVKKYLTALVQRDFGDYGRDVRRDCVCSAEEIAESLADKFCFENDDEVLEIEESDDELISAIWYNLDILELGRAESYFDQFREKDPEPRYY